jgi:O-methyltransferase
MAMLTMAKRAIERGMRLAGYEIRRLPPSTGADYGPLQPLADYCPWAGDAHFQKTYSAIKSHTLVDVYRCHELWQLVEQAAKLPEGDLIEVGVWRGGTGGLLATRCASLGLNCRVYLCDTFTGVVKADAAEKVYAGGEHSDTSIAIVKALMRDLGVENEVILEGIFPDDTGVLVGDSRFRFAHIDVDVYRSAKESVEWLWPRLVIGGMMVYDDYGFQQCEGITRFVNEQRKYADRVVMYNLNGHAVIVKTAEAVPELAQAAATVT